MFWQSHTSPRVSEGNWHTATQTQFCKKLSWKKIKAKPKLDALHTDILMVHVLTFTHSLGVTEGSWHTATLTRCFLLCFFQFSLLQNCVCVAVCQFLSESPTEYVTVWTWPWTACLCGGYEARVLLWFFLNLASYKTVSVWRCVSSPQRPPGSMWLLEHGHELHSFVECIQVRFCSDFFSFLLLTELCQCGSVSVPLRDPQGVCDCMAMWRVSS